LRVTVEERYRNSFHAIEVGT